MDVSRARVALCVVDAVSTVMVAGVVCLKRSLLATHQACGDVQVGVEPISWLATDLQLTG